MASKKKPELRLPSQVDPAIAEQLVLLGEAGVVDRFDAQAQTVVTAEGYELPTDVDEFDCGAPLDTGQGTMALVDPVSGRVVALSCLGDG